MAQPERHDHVDPSDLDDDVDLFDIEDPEAEEAAWREGEADIAAGRVVPHEEVAKWLQAWGKDPNLKMPKEWLT